MLFNVLQLPLIAKLIAQELLLHIAYEMSDNWAMELARDLEVETSEPGPVGIASPSGSGSELDYYEYVEQSIIGGVAPTDDGKQIISAVNCF